MPVLGIEIENFNRVQDSSIALVNCNCHLQFVVKATEDIEFSIGTKNHGEIFPWSQHRRHHSDLRSLTVLSEG